MKSKEVAVSPTTATEPEATGYSLSQKAADQCRQIVEATAQVIEGRKYVKVEGWQAIAIAHGCVGSARDVESVHDPKGLLLGYRAVGEVRRVGDGVVIATGEGFVGSDEVTWFGGQRGGKTYYARPAYAVRAMAQTRAISRACRSAFAHVVVIINRDLSTTPAEEMEYLHVETAAPTAQGDIQRLHEDALRRGHGEKVKGANRKVGAPIGKEELLKRQDDQLEAAMKWVNDHLPSIRLMGSASELAEWEANETVKPRLDALRQGRDRQPGYEHLKDAWEHYAENTKGLRP